MAAHYSMQQTKGGGVQVANLGGSVAEGEVEGGRQALVGPACKVNHLHAEAAAEPHDIGGPQIPMHNLSLMKPCHCLAHLHNRKRLITAVLHPIRINEYTPGG